MFVRNYCPLNFGIKFIVLQFLAISIPASLVFYYALNAGMLPDNDYWGFITHFLSERGGFSTEISDWVKRDNEHYVLFPKIIYAINIAITGGNNVALSLFTWFMALLQVWLMYHLIPDTFRQKPVVFTGLVFVISVFVFSPTQAHNWFFGMSGVAWISANFFSLSAIYSLNHYAKTERKVFIIATMVFSLFAIATYSTSLAVFPTLIIATIFLKLKRLNMLLIVLFSIAIVSLYLSTYTTPSHHPSLKQPVYLLITYFFTFIGSIFTTKSHFAMINGALGVISSVLMLLIIYKKKTNWKRVLPWLFIQLYVCGNAAMASLARSGFNIEQAFASRYSSLPSLFWVSWVVIATTLCAQLSKRFSLTLIGISSILIVCTFQVGLGVVVPFKERAEKKQLTLAALYSYAFDIDLIHNTFITGVPIELMNRLTRVIEYHQHIPFNGMFDSCPKIGGKITRVHEPIKKQYTGKVDSLKLGRNLIIEMQGWANNNNQDPVCIAFVNINNIVKGIASVGLNRMDVAMNIPSISSQHTGWQGYAKFEIPDKMIKVYMLSEYDQYWIPLVGFYNILPSAPYLQRVEELPVL